MGAVVSSFLAVAAVGRGWANIVRGVPIDADQEFTGTLFTLLNPYGLLGGVTTVLLFLSHGAIYLEPAHGRRRSPSAPARSRAGPRPRPPWPGSLPGLDGRSTWRAATRSSIALAVVAAVLLVVSATSALARRPGLAFALSAGAIVALFATLFVDLFPQVMPSSTNAACRPHDRQHVVVGLHADGDDDRRGDPAAGRPALPGLDYWVFRKRVSPEDFDPELRNPLDVDPRGPRRAARGVARAGGGRRPRRPPVDHARDRAPAPAHRALRAAPARGRRRVGHAHRGARRRAGRAGREGRRRRLPRRRRACVPGRAGCSRWPPRSWRGRCARGAFETSGRRGAPARDGGTARAAGGARAARAAGRLPRRAAPASWSRRRCRASRRSRPGSPATCPRRSWRSRAGRRAGVRAPARPRGRA